jgi:hypothetical protein
LLPFYPPHEARLVLPVILAPTQKQDRFDPDNLPMWVYCHKLLKAYWLVAGGVALIYLVEWLCRG